MQNVKETNEAWNWHGADIMYILEGPSETDLQLLGHVQLLTLIFVPNSYSTWDSTVMLAGFFGLSFLSFLCALMSHCV